MLTKLKSIIQGPQPSAQDETFDREIKRYREFFMPLGKDSTNEWIQKSSSIPGWLFPGEHELLWQLTHESPAGHVLEIGSWLGKSACILAGGCVARNDGSKLFCIDPFDMRGDEWQREFHRRLTGSVALTFDGFVANAHRLGYYDRVVPIAKPSEDLIGLLSFRLRFAFIDGWHDYEHVRRDFDLTSPMVVPGGFLALHDATGDFPGVKQFAEELANSTAFKVFGRAGSIVAFKKQ